MKQDLNGVRTPEDVMRRLADNVKVTSDEVNGLTIEVSKKVGDDEIISKINQSAEQVSINANKIKLEGYTTINNGFSVDENGNMSCNEATMVNANVVNGELNMTAPNGSVINIGAFEGIAVTDNSLAPDYIQSAIYSADGAYIYDDDSGFVASYFNSGGMGCTDPDDRSSATVDIDGGTGEITCVHLTQTSLEEKKKDFEKLESGLDIVKDTDIYKYHFKKEKETDKKHIGFIIGNNYKYRQELTDKDNKGVDLYSMVSVLWRAVQEQQVEIEKLKEAKNDKD